MHFKAAIVEKGREMPASAVARIVGINEDSVWRILKHYVEDARKNMDLSDLKVLGINEFSVERPHVYVTLFYYMRNSKVIHMEDSKESDVFGKFIMKHPSLDPSGIDYIAMDMFSGIHIRRQEIFPRFLHSF